MIRERGVRRTDIPLFHRSQRRKRGGCAYRSGTHVSRPNEDETHPLRDNNPQHEEGEEHGGPNPSIKDERRDLIEPLLVLALGLRQMCGQRLEGGSRGLWIG